MRAGDLRRKTSYLFGAFLLICGGLAGAAVADGAPSVGLPTTVLSTIGITTSITVPSVTVTVPTPMITVPTPTVTVTVPTPTVTTPVTTVSPPPATTAVVATVPVPTVAATVSTPPVTLKTPPVPAVTVAASVASQPTVSAGVTVASAPAQAGVTATGAVVQARVATGAQGAGTQPTRSQTLGAAATLGTGGTPVATVSGADTTPAGTAVSGTGSIGGAGSNGAGPLAALSATSRAAAPTLGARPLPTAAGRPPARPSESAATVLLSPLASDLTAGSAPGPARGGSVQQAQVRPNPRPASGWSSTDTRRAAAGGLAALLALGAIGLAAAARSSAGVALCGELSRFPFPRFRILPCLGVGHVARSGFEAGPAAAPTSGHTGAATSSPLATVPRRPRGSRFPLPRIGGVLGTAFSKPHPWEILRAVALGLLAFANAVLLAIRWRIGRLHVP